MPEVRNYVVSQTREVNVRANSLVDAVRIAHEAFENGQNPDGGYKFDGTTVERLQDVWGNTTSHVKETDVNAREAY